MLVQPIVSHIFGDVWHQQSHVPYRYWLRMYTWCWSKTYLRPNWPRCRLFPCSIWLYKNEMISVRDFTLPYARMHDTVTCTSFSFSLTMCQRHAWCARADWKPFAHECHGGTRINACTWLCTHACMCTTQIHVHMRMCTTRMYIHMIFHNMLTIRSDNAKQWRALAFLYLYVHNIYANVHTHIVYMYMYTHINIAVCAWLDAHVHRDSHRYTYLTYTHITSHPQM